MPAEMKKALGGQVLTKDESFVDALPDPWLSRIWNIFDEYKVEESLSFFSKI